MRANALTPRICCVLSSLFLVCFYNIRSETIRFRRFNIITDVVSSSSSWRSRSSTHKLVNDDAMIDSSSDDDDEDDSTLIIDGDDDDNSTSVVVPYEKEMKEKNMILSLRQQRKFQAKKNLISIEHFPNETLWSLDEGPYYAIILNDNFAFRHIFKNGGTTVARQVKSHQNQEVVAKKKKPVQVKKIEIGNRSLIFTIRDPIDHFFSGWRECGSKAPRFMGRDIANDDSLYDGRIKKWLELVKEKAHKDIKCPKNDRIACGCRVHSFPQTNYLIGTNGTIDPRAVVVGDLLEMADLLSLVGFQYNNTLGTANNATENKRKNAYFPIRLDLVSNETMLAICNFVILDYVLFDFELPEACRILRSEVEALTASVS